MTFDPCPHKITQVVLRAGAIIRELKGLPREDNITILYNEMAPILGIPLDVIGSSTTDHLPAPHEMTRSNGMPVIPLQKCNNYGKNSMEIFGLCPTCEDAKGEKGEPGKYKTKFVCKECSYFEKSEKHMVIWLQEMGVDFVNQPKSALGIKTVTDDGIK